MTSLWETRRRALRALIPPPRLALSACIETNIRLPQACRGCPGSAKFSLCCFLAKKSERSLAWRCIQWA